MLKLIYIKIFLFLPIFLFARETIAIIDFEGINVSEGDAKALTNRVISELIEIDEFRVLERSEMKKLLDEQKFQYSGCVDKKCAVKIGQLIEAKFITVGSVSKVGNTYSADSRLINVETGESYGSGTFNHTGEIDYLLTEGMKSIAYQLCELDYEPKPAPPIKTVMDFTPTIQSGNQTVGGHLIINSEPQGATVFIDESELGITPIEIKNYPIGEYEIGLELENYYQYKDNEKYTFYTQKIKIVPFATLKINEKFVCAINIDCAGECGGTKVFDECGVCDGKGIEEGKCDCDGNVIDCFNLCGGSAKLDDCNVCNGDNLDKDCDGICFGENVKRDFCFDANGDGDGDIKTKKLFCLNEVEEEWVDKCVSIQGEFLINSQIKNLTHLRIGGRNILNQKHPISLSPGRYQVFAQSTYFWKEFTIIKNVDILEDELTTLFINENEIKEQKEQHLKFVKYTSGTAFAFWLIWGLLPYDM